MIVIAQWYVIQKGIIYKTRSLLRIVFEHFTSLLMSSILLQIRDGVLWVSLNACIYIYIYIYIYIKKLYNFPFLQAYSHVMTVIALYLWMLFSNAMIPYSTKKNSYLFYPYLLMLSSRLPRGLLDRPPMRLYSCYAFTNFPSKISRCIFSAVVACFSSAGWSRKSLFSDLHFSVAKGNIIIFISILKGVSGFVLYRQVVKMYI